MPWTENYFYSILPASSIRLCRFPGRYAKQAVSEAASDGNPRKERRVSRREEAPRKLGRVRKD
jgi:hypothetical protein